MIISGAWEAPRDVLMLDDTETTLVPGENTNSEHVVTRMSATTEWIVKAVITRCREVDQGTPGPISFIFMQFIGKNIAK